MRKCYCDTKTIFMENEKYILWDENKPIFRGKMNPLGEIHISCQKMHSKLMLNYKQKAIYHWIKKMIIFCILFAIIHDNLQQYNLFNCYVKGEKMLTAIFIKFSSLFDICARNMKYFPKFQSFSS